MDSCRRSQFEVRSPERLIGSYVDVAAPFGPPLYEITHLVALATTCPCDWLATASSSAAASDLALQDWLVLLPSHLCPLACSSELAACAANLYNASGLLMSGFFNQPPPAPPPPPDTPVAPPPPPPSTEELDSVKAARDQYQADATRLGCSSRVPASLITPNMSSVLAAAGSWGLTLLPSHLAGGVASNASTVLRMAPGSDNEVNVTIVRLATDSSIDCSKYHHTPTVYALFVPIWMALTVAWTWSTYYRHAAHARDLHRLMCWVPIIETVHGLLSLFNYVSCPWESILSLVYATFWSIVTILKEPVMLLCLLLVSKGWCITRHFLHRREVCIAGTILALLYASVSVQMSLQTPLALIPMVVMYIAMLVEIAWSILNNLRILKAQLLALRALGVDPTTTPAFTKYKMFYRLAIAVACYALLELAIHWIFSDGRFENHFWLFCALHQAIELLVAVAVGLTFRAQPFNVLFTQVQQVAAELADQMLPSITTIEVKPEMLQGDNLIAWRADLGLGGAGGPSRLVSPNAPPTLVVLNPGDTQVEDPVTVRSSSSNRAADAAVYVRSLTQMAALNPQGPGSSMPWASMASAASNAARPSQRAPNHRPASTQRSAPMAAAAAEPGPSVEMRGAPLPRGGGAPGQPPSGLPPGNLPPSPGVSPPSPMQDSAAHQPADGGGEALQDLPSPRIE